MAAVRLAALVLCSLLAGISSPGTAAPTSIPVGDTQVVLDAPSGYADTTYLGSPRLQDLAESLTPASNRVLLFAISDDAELTNSGHWPFLRGVSVPFRCLCTMQ
jgi:hypothetical protein